MAYHYGSDNDKQKAEKLEIQLLQDDTKEAGVLNRVLQCMRNFKKHDKKVPRQEGRESRGYAVDMVKMLHVVLRVYERICKSGFVLHREPGRAGAQSDSSEDENEGNEPIVCDLYHFVLGLNSPDNFRFHMCREARTRRCVGDS